MSSELSQNIIKNYEEEYEKVPEKNKLFDWLNDLIQILFPYQKTSEQEINSRIQSSKKLFQHLVLNVGITEENAEQYTAVMYENLIQVHQDLLQDAKEFLKKESRCTVFGRSVTYLPWVLCNCNLSFSTFNSSKITINILAENAHRIYSQQNWH